MENDMLLDVAKQLIDNTDNNKVEMVNVSHTEYPDGSKGFVVEVKFPSDDTKDKEEAYFK